MSVYMGMSSPKSLSMAGQCQVNGRLMAGKRHIKKAPNLVARLGALIKYIST